MALGKDGQPYVGTGVEGRVYTVNKQRQSVLVADIEARQISALLLGGPVPALFSSDTSGVHLVHGQGGKQSIWTSKVLDAGIRANYGRVDWEASRAVEVAGWLATRGDKQSRGAPLRAKGRTLVPEGRYLQLRVRFAVDSEAALTRIEVPFVTDNQRAVVTKIDVAGK